MLSLGPRLPTAACTGRPRAALEEIGPQLLGAEALRITRVHDVMESALNGSRYAKAAVDIALWDIAGKVYGARVCDLLGGAVRESVPSYYAIGLLPVDEAAAIAAEKRREGYPRLQLKVGGRDLEEDIAAACVHIGATVHPRLMEGVWLAAPYIEKHYDRQNGPKIENGWIRVPQGPGLGIEPDRTLWGTPVMSFG